MQLRGGEWISGVSVGHLIGIYTSGIERFQVNDTGLIVRNVTAPGSSPVDCFQLYSNDQIAGNACPYIRTENGAIIKLYQHTGIVDADGTLADLTTKFNSLVAKLEADGTLAVL